MFTVVKEEVGKARQEFNDRIDGLASKLECKIKQSIEGKIETTLNQAKEDLKRDIDLSSVKRDITAVKKSYAEITNSEVGIENNIVIRNYEVDARESTDSQTTLNMVNTLICDGLKFRGIKVVKCERKQSRGQKHEVIIATIANRDQKQKEM